MFDDDFHDRLHTVLLALCAPGPQPLDLLVRLARRELRDARVGEDAVCRMVDLSALLVGRPDGSITTLLHLLEGQVLTHRVTSPTAGRTDLWTREGLEPLFASAATGEVHLADGRPLRAAEHGHQALLGPPGWLPEAGVGDYLGFAVRRGRVAVELVDPDTFPGLVAEQEVRAVLSRHLHVFHGLDDLVPRRLQLCQALGNAVLERPTLLADPVPPLEELLHRPLDVAEQDHFARNIAAWCEDTVSFVVAGMPEYLHGELEHRARRYGMSFDQFIVAVLSHLAWRTPFAEDLGPWESWSDESSPTDDASVTALPAPVPPT